MSARSLDVPLTLSDLVGEGHRLVVRAPDARSRWLGDDLMARDAMSAAADAGRGTAGTLVALATRTPRVRCAIS